MSTQIERRKATRRALIAAARELFAEDGFAETSTEAVVSRARVTRGALYHHFSDKTELFAAFFEDVEAGLVQDLVSSLPPVEEPLELLSYGMGVFFDRCLDPAVRHIVLVEGPSVLGWERWSSIERRYGLGFLEAVLRTAADNGELRPLPVETLAHVLLGALVEGALLLAASDDPAQTRRELEETVTAILDGLRA